MRVPKEIADKVAEYQDLVERTESLRKDIENWLNENTAADGVDIGEIYIADQPTGEKQWASEDEYCEQHPFGICEDSFYGKYYHRIEGSEKYVGYDYSC